MFLVLVAEEEEGVEGLDEALRIIQMVEASVGTSKT